MHFRSSLLDHSQPEQPPCIIFRGPDSQGYIQAISASHQELARLRVSGHTISRLSHTSQQQICTFKQSSLSGTITLQLHGQEIKIKQSWEGMRYGKDIEAPAGKLEWRAGSGGYEELRDARKTLLARGKLPGTLRRKNCDLEVFVMDDAFLLDLILASWISTIT